jgi:hypothetical protein
MEPHARGVGALPGTLGAVRSRSAVVHYENDNLIYPCLGSLNPKQCLPFTRRLKPEPQRSPHSPQRSCQTAPCTAPIISKYTEYIVGYTHRFACLFDHFQHSVIAGIALDEHFLLFEADVKRGYDVCETRGIGIGIRMSPKERDTHFGPLPSGGHE